LGNRASYRLKHGTHLRFLLVFFVDPVSWDVPDPFNTSFTSGDLHWGQKDFFPVLW
jgi:hypothetical protein